MSAALKRGVRPLAPLTIREKEHVDSMPIEYRHLPELIKRIFSPDCQVMATRPISKCKFFGNHEIRLQDVPFKREGVVEDGVEEDEEDGCGEEADR